MKMICEVPDEVIKCIKDGTWCGSSVAEKMIANGIPLNSSEEPCEDAISRYQKIKQMLYELKEMPLAPCLMKGHICAVHEILNEVMEPSTSSSQKPKSEWQHDHEILKAYSDGASAVLDKVRAEIEERKLNSGGEPNRELAFNVCLQIIDGYMTEEDKA